MSILSKFPQLYDQYQAELEDSLSFCSSPSNRWGMFVQSNAIGDPTGRRALRLLKVEAQGEKLQHIRRWIDEQLAIEDRKMMLLVWAHHDFCEISQRLGMPVGRCLDRWRKINRDLEVYCRTAFAGNACASGGTACVQCQDAPRMAQ